MANASPSRRNAVLLPAFPSTGSEGPAPRFPFGPVFERPDTIASGSLPEIAPNRRVEPGEPGSATALLTCPVRGPLNAAALARDGLTPSEEKRRIDFIHYLLRRAYPASHIDVETVVIKQLGNQGRNRVRADVVVYAVPREDARTLRDDERFNEALLVAEIKRDSAGSRTALGAQLEPAIRQLPRLAALGVYWDDVHRTLLFKRLVERDGKQFIEVDHDDLANLPRFGQPYEAAPITLATLTPPSNLLGTLQRLANVMRSHGVNDTHLRYKETVKLLLARYIDEREAQARRAGELHLQVYKGRDDAFANRVASIYKKSARRYARAKTLFTPVAGSELEEPVLRDVVRIVQGMHLSSASTEALQQVFMSFVPAVFKKELDQYFTPLTLVETMVDMARIGPTDRVADPGMGTGDFLTTAMAVRTAAGDTDMDQRILGIDKDQQAYDLAVVNMILNRDGQSGLEREDSIEQADRWREEMDVVLCNPPFGAQTIETRPHVLRHYDLGHRWERDAEGAWLQTAETLESQQLGLLFIERSLSMLVHGGRLAIIVPEGYLCTPSYGYVRQWLLDMARVLSVVELPRRMFLRSNADLRANILLLQKLSPTDLEYSKNANYRIHAGLVRKVGYKLGRGFPPTVLRDPETGLQIMGSDNEPLLDTDFTNIRATFDQFHQGSDSDDDWRGARYSDVAQHPGLDLKPRRLMPRALENIKRLRATSHVRLRDIADVIEPEFDITASPADVLQLVEGQSIRAVEGTVIPHSPERAWAIAQRKTGLVYRLQDNDIVVGLVRPERRNVGLLLLTDRGRESVPVVGSPDGVAIVRVRPDAADAYPQGWLFAMLRSERSRLQLWTESGGTSYGKLTTDQIRDLVLPRQRKDRRVRTNDAVTKWAESMRTGLEAWQSIGSEEDRAPILNSAIYGLEADSE